jgi:hypothetical protein
MILNPTAESRKSARPEKAAKLRKGLEQLHAQEILNDDSLDN